MITRRINPPQTKNNQAFSGSIQLRQTQIFPPQRESPVNPVPLNDMLFNVSAESMTFNNTGQQMEFNT